MPAPSRPAGTVIPEQASGPRRALAWLIWFLIETLGRTLRWEIEDPHGTREVIRRQPVIFSIWHNRLALSLGVHRLLVRGDHPDRRLAAMVSASRDGGLLARVMELSGVVPIRGSSSRRGPQALRELARLGDSGMDLALTPDGPRGPRYVVQPGVIAMARLTRLPVVPISINATPRLTLRSWDRFHVPLPFARCRICIGGILPVEDADEASRERLRVELEHRLHQLIDKPEPGGPA